MAEPYHVVIFCEFCGHPQVIDESVSGGKTVTFKLFKATYGNRIACFLAESVEETEAPPPGVYDDPLDVGYSNDTPEETQPNVADHR